MELFAVFAVVIGFSALPLLAVGVAMWREFSK